MRLAAAAAYGPVTSALPTRSWGASHTHTLNDCEALCECVTRERCVSETVAETPPPADRHLALDLLIPAHAEQLWWPLCSYASNLLAHVCSHCGKARRISPWGVSCRQAVRTQTCEHRGADCIRSARGCLVRSATLAGSTFLALAASFAADAATACDAWSITVVIRSREKPARARFLPV